MEKHPKLHAMSRPCRKDEPEIKDEADDSGSDEEMPNLEDGSDGNGMEKMCCLGPRELPLVRGSFLSQE